MTTRAPRRPVLLNGLGDSITAQPVFQDVTAPDGRFPSWQPGTRYAIGQCVRNAGLAFACIGAGISGASGGPSPDASDATTPLADGTAIWNFLVAQAGKNGFFGGFLGWAEAFSLDALAFDQTQGYGGFVSTIRKIIVVSGGQGYTAPTIELEWGAAATASVVDGRIVDVAVTNPGNGPYFGAIVADDTGSGAVLSVVIDGTGTFGVSGCTTADMVARLPDCLASDVAVFTVHGGTNDLAASVPAEAIFANLRDCYETLMDAGRKVIAIPILPRTFQVSDALYAAMLDVNSMIRAYCAGVQACNPRAYAGIALADCSALMTDRTDPTIAANIGGTSGSAEAVLIEGLHPSVRGGMYMGLVVWQAAQRLLPGLVPYTFRAGSDGYDVLRNPRGNLLEGLPWLGGARYVPGQLCANAGTVYAVAQAGRSAGSGGPSGSDDSIIDGTVVWRAVRPAGMSVFAGAGGTSIPASGVEIAGDLAAGYTLLRSLGTATGSILQAVEGAGPDGDVGRGQVLTFRLGSGTEVESWMLVAMGGDCDGLGLVAADLDSARFSATLDMQVSEFRNLSSIYLLGPCDGAVLISSAGSTGVGTGARWAGHVGDVIGLPNDGRLRLTTPPLRLPPTLRGLSLAVCFNFDTSDAAGTATATVMLHHLAVTTIDAPPRAAHAADQPPPGVPDPGQVDGAQEPEGGRP